MSLSRSLYSLVLSLVLVTSIAGAQGLVTTQNVASGRGITVELKDVTLERALTEIARQAGMRLVYNDAVVSLKRKTSVQIQDVPLTSALGSALRGTGLEATLAHDGGTIVIAKQKSSGVQRIQGVITGKVVDSKTGRGLSGANVSVENRGVVTGEDGSYRLTGVGTGNQVISVRMLGYTKQTRSVTVGEGATVTVDFKMETSANVLDQVVVTGTVVSTELKAVPSAMTVITAKQIEERGITHIDQLFRGEIPGLFAQNRGGDNPLDSVVMYSRGTTRMPAPFAGLQIFATNPIKTYVDGIELARPEYLSQIDPKSIERIEILTGPQASTIYGSNTINGVMQIFTKRGSTSRPQVKLNLSSGLIANNFHSSLTPVHAYDGDVSGSEGRLSYNAGLSWNYTGSWTPAVQVQRISAYGGARMQMGSLTTDVSARNGITKNLSRGNPSVTTYLSESGIYVNSATTGRVQPATSTLYGRTVGLNLRYAPTSWWSHELILGSDASEVESISSQPGYTSFPPGGKDTLGSFSHSYNDRVSERYTMTTQMNVAGVASLNLSMGGDHWRNKGSSISAQPVVLTGTLNGPTITRVRPQTNSGGFLQGQLGIKDELFLTYGLRAEWNPNYGEEAQPNLAPRYGIAYTRSIGPILTAKLRASYGRSTRPPGTEKLAMPSTDNFAISLFGPYNQRVANPDLGPEFQQGGEGGIELYLGSRGSIIVTRYNQTVDGLINSISPFDSVRSLLPDAEKPCIGIPVASNGYCYTYQQINMNVGSIRNQGWELQGTVNTGPLTTVGTYSWTKSRFLGITPKYRYLFSNVAQFTFWQPGSTVSFFPEHTWSVTTTYARAWTRVSLNVNGTGFSYRIGDDLSLQASSALRLRAQQSPVWSLPNGRRPLGPGYAMADLNISQKLSSNMDGTLQIQNLTDYYRNDYNASAAVIGRQARVGLRVRL